MLAIGILFLIAVLAFWLYGPEDKVAIISKKLEKYWILLVVGGVVFFGLIFYYSFNPCSAPVKYSIGDVDDRFGLSEKGLIKALGKAGQIWETGTSRELFSYDTNAELEVNLVFDERQRKALEEERLREQLDKEGNSYDDLVTDFDKRFEAYESEVSDWNNVGGAPSDVYYRLENERIDLERLANRIETLASKYNLKVDLYNRKFGKDYSFDQGKWILDEDGQRIDIYQFYEETDLVFVLAHELGHALGLDHVEDAPTSLMYDTIFDQDLNDPKLSREDISYVDNFCRFYFLYPDFWQKLYYSTVF